MNIFYPIGFLGLVGIVILLLIYLLKPNYQQKFVSSTFVWKLSLKYRKKRIPISRLTTILLLICQILIITVAAFIFAQPYIKSPVKAAYDEKILIIDASASMWTTDESNVTRFERAVLEAKTLGGQTIAQNGVTTVILAGASAAYATDVSTDSKTLFDSAMDALIQRNELKCTFGSADIEGSMRLSEPILVANPSADIILYTDTEYAIKDKVEVRNLSDDAEWNVAIQGVSVKMVENRPVFYVTLVSYGFNLEVSLNIKIEGANEEENDFNETRTAELYDGIPFVLVLNGISDEGVEDKLFDPKTEKQLAAFKAIRFNIELTQPDSFTYDNAYYLCGGEGSVKPPLKMQYYSSLPNGFFGGMLMNLEQDLKDIWNIELTSVPYKGTPQLSGFDFYLFEHAMPATVPTDGVLLLSDPDVVPNTLPEPLTLVLGEEVKMSQGEDYYRLSPEKPHEITRYVNPENIMVSKYRRVIAHEGFEVLMSCLGDPVFLVADHPTAKVGILTINIHYTDLSLLIDFPFLMYGIFDYFLPSTLTKNIFNINEAVLLNARGSSLTVTGPGFDGPKVINEFPGSVSAGYPGVYTVTQTLLGKNEDGSDRLSKEEFYVRIPAAESNFAFVEPELKEAYFPPEPDPIDVLLLLYFAAAIVFLLFAEWWLQGRFQS